MAIPCTLLYVSPNEKQTGFKPANYGLKGGFFCKAFPQSVGEGSSQN
jgi:hypothetical protein